MLKGHALFDTEDGLAMLNEAVTRSHSPLARAIRAELRCANLSHEPQPRLDELDLLLSDIRTAKELLPDNLFVTSTSATVHLLAARIYGELGRPSAEQSELAAAAAEVKAARAFDQASRDRAAVMGVLQSRGN